MDVRDAVEGDAEALAELADAPPGVLRNVVHDRTVRVLVDDEAPAVDEEIEAADDGTEMADDDTNRAVDDDAADGPATPQGFVSFDVRDGVVHLTLFGGDRTACERLLAEPLRFAECEGMPVEVLVGDDDAAMREALESVGFENRGTGPRFHGSSTERFRYDATA